MTLDDTIAAISSPPQACARIIVRMSGPDARRIAAQLTTDELPAAGHAKRLRLRLSRGVSFPAWLYVFAAPRSYTTQDLVEFHIPGNPLLARMFLGDLFTRGARQADPGEFTARAFFSGRMDLAEAEGVAATIAAASDRELRAARQLLSGELAHRLRPALEDLADTLALVETGIDFSDEDITFLAEQELLSCLARSRQSLDDLISTSARFERLTHEPRIALVGRPNAGKSTLLNALAGSDRAVVSPIPGTTRDILSAEIRLARGMIQLLDLAGLDESALTHIDQQMQSHAQRALASADAILLLHDATDPRPPLDLPRRADLVVYSKADLLAQPPPNPLHISAHTALNLRQLRDRLDELAFGPRSGSSVLALNARHLHAIAEARSALARAQSHPAAGAELLALDLREALDALGQVLGQVSPDDVLSRIFSRFCIGK